MFPLNIIADNTMVYPEFCQYKSFVDPSFPLVNAYRTKDGHVFYVEPGFYLGLQGYKERRFDRFDEIMAAIDKVVSDNEKVIFTGNFESPFMSKEGFIYREIQDIADPLGIYVEDKSRGSDYGD